MKCMEAPLLLRCLCPDRVVDRRNDRRRRRPLILAVPSKGSSRRGWLGPRVYLSVQERRDVGRSCRSVMPRSSLADFAIPKHRPDPVALLESQNTSRIASLVPIRYQRMLSSPFPFFVAQR
jgi:hypothetical protein